MSASDADLFGELRSLLQRPPSEPLWRALCSLLDTTPDDLVTHRALPYAMAHIDRWPHALTRAPEHWGQRLLSGEAPAALAIASSVELDSTGASRDQLEAAFRHLERGRIRELVWRDDALDRFKARALGHSQLVTRLDGVSFVAASLPDATALSPLLNAPRLTDEHTLSLTVPGAEDLDVLLTSPGAKRLTALALTGDCTKELLTAIAHSPYLERLAKLDLENAFLDPDALPELRYARSLRGLKSMTINMDASLSAWTVAAWFSGPDELSMSSYEVPWEVRDMKSVLDLDGALELRRVRLRAPLGDDALRLLAAHPHTQRLTHLELDHMSIPTGWLSSFGDDSEQALEDFALSTWSAPINLSSMLEGPTGGSLRTLSLSSIGLDAARVRVLTDSDLPALRGLTLERGDLGDSGLASIADAPWTRALESLHLRQARKDLDADSGVVRLLEGLGGARMGSLSLTEAAVRAHELHAGLTDALHHLDALSLAFNPLSDEGARALCQRAPAGIRRLDVRGCAIGPDGADAMAHAPRLGGVTELVLSNNPIGSDGVRSILRSTSLAHISHLTLDRLGLDDDLARGEFLAECELPRLTHLQMHGCGLTEDDLEQLAGAPWLSQLTSLSLLDNGFGSRGIRAICSSPYLGHITGLWLKRRGFYDADAFGWLADAHSIPELFIERWRKRRLNTMLSSSL